MKLSALVLFALLSAADAYEKVEVIADRVNLRAEANISSRVMGQVSRGEILDRVSSTGSWTAVIPPTNVALWIQQKLIHNGITESPRANLRSGPGINYEVMLSIDKGTPLQIQGSFKDWMMVRPPDGSTVWISSEFIQEVARASETTHTDAASPPASNNVKIAAKPPMPADHPLLRQAVGKAAQVDPLVNAAGITSDMLDESAPQGNASSFSGLLRKTSIAWQRPSRFSLVDKSNERICYVSGNDTQLSSITDKPMSVEGPVYYIREAKAPLIVAKRIVLQ